MHFSSQAKERYSRQLLLPEFGEAGQTRLKAGSVLIIGAGGLGSAAAFYLTAAGIGRIGLADADQVQLSNLHRQILHQTADLNKAKVASAVPKLRALNPDVQLQGYPFQITRENICDLIRDYDFVIDAVDHSPTKYLISDTGVQQKKAFCHAGVDGYNGLLFTYLPNGQSGCLRCLFPHPPAEPAAPAPPRAVLGPVPGVLGALQAIEAIKFFLGQGELLVNRLLIFRAKTIRFHEINFQPSSDCPVCQARF